MRLAIVCFVAGAWLLQQQAALPDSRWAWALGALGLAGAAIRLRSTLLRLARGTLTAAACLVLGFAWAAWCAQHRLADALPAGWEGRDIALTGVVAALPQVYERGVRFEFDVERVLTPDARAPARVVLSWWGSPARDDRPASFPQLHAGERWELTVRLKRPRGTANPHGFDYEAWLLERNLRATGYVRPKAVNRRIADRVQRPGYWIERLRERVRGRIQAALPDAPYAGVIAALAIGDQRAIPPEQWQTFTRTGVNHLMSISGLHVTMVSGLVFVAIGGLWRRIPRFTLVLPAPKAATLSGLGAALIYALLAGYAVPAQRTVYMLAVVAAALWLGVIESSSVVLCLALLVVVLIDPWAVLAPGFWLSFGAVAAILYVTSGRVGGGHWLATWGRVQLAVTLALVPLLLALFQQVSAVSPVANALAIPAVSLAVVPLTLTGILMPFDLGLQCAHLVMSGCMIFLEWLAGLPEAMWQQHAPLPWTIVVAVAATALLLAPRGLPARWLGIAGFAPLFTLVPAALQAGAVQVVVLDVGQGVAVLVRTQRHALLYDAGPHFGPGADSGNRIIVPYLRAAGVKRVDGLIVSHDDDDHWGGATSVLQALPVDWLLTSLPDLDPLVVQTEPSLRCATGQSWEWDGVRFEVLHPARASYDNPAVKDNDRSCVLAIEAPGGRVLLPGDIERRSEDALLRSARGKLRTDVLLAPHQGSRTSSLPEFVAAAGARIVVFPVGYRNRFGHPHHEVMRRYAESGARIYRTDRDGALTILIAATGAISVTPHRAAYRRYWQTQFENDPVPDPEELRGTKNEKRETRDGKPGGSGSRRRDDR